MRKLLFVFWLIFIMELVTLLMPGVVLARDFGLGVHLLSPDELSLVLPYRGKAEKFYVTVPFHVDETRVALWQNFFELAAHNKVTPLLRLTTTFEPEKGYWRIPTQMDIVMAARFLKNQPWQGERVVILFNEPNHAKEWGGTLNPEEYADLAMFGMAWFQTENLPYVMLTAGMDGAAPNSSVTMDSMDYLRRVFERQPDLVNRMNGWNSHSYPNPGFVAPAYVSGKNSLRGFEYELALLKNYGREGLPVYITETGWRQTRSTLPYLNPYYKYAFDHIWTHPQVKAVTVFLLRGEPGPFGEFSLLDVAGKPTRQMEAFEVVNDLLGH